jgi:pimeloyl-ACP methyl ester carboxylesterase
MKEGAAKKKFLPTKHGRIAHLEMDSGGKSPVLFAHGIPTSSYLWRHVLGFLGPNFICYAPDLMGLGDTVVDPDKTEFHMASQAEMLIEFMRCLGHDAFALVCHDQGGAAAQIIAAEFPEKLTCLVIADCVCYDCWPVPTIRRLQALARLPVLLDWLCRTGIVEWFETRTHFSNFRRGFYDPAKMDISAISEYLRPLRGNRNERRRFLKFLLAGDSSHTEQAVSGLKRFDKPTLIIWASNDNYLSPALGRRLFEDIPGARRFEVVNRCGHFWPEECPGAFSAVIREFLEKHLERIG